MVWEDHWNNMVLYTLLIDGDCLLMCNTDGHSNINTGQALVEMAKRGTCAWLGPGPCKR